VRPSHPPRPSSAKLLVRSEKWLAVSAPAFLLLATAAPIPVSRPSAPAPEKALYGGYLFAERAAIFRPLVLFPARLIRV